MGSAEISAGICVMHCRQFVPAALAVMLSGCSGLELSWAHREGLDYFVGKDEALLIADLGSPTRREIVPQGEDLSYTYRQNVFLPGDRYERDPITNRWSTPSVDDVDCTTSFRIEAGRVAAWRIEGHSCRGVGFPAVRRYAAQVLNTDPASSIAPITPFPHEPTTGDSTIDKGVFYSR